MKKVLSISIFVFLFFAASLFLKVSSSLAASFYLSPASASVQINNNITVDVNLDTQGVGVQTATVVLNYDASKFQFSSIDASTSAFDSAIGGSGGAGAVKMTRYVGPTSDSTPITPVNGNVLFAKVIFKALVGTGSSPITFNTDPTQFSYTVAYDSTTGLPLAGTTTTGGNYTLTGTVIPPATAPTVSIKANSSNGPITITYNTAATIAWTSTNASTCAVTANSSAFGTGISGSKSSGNLTANAVYAASCSGSGGTANGSVTVNVGAPPAGTKPTPAPTTKPTPAPSIPTPAPSVVSGSQAPVISDVKVTSVSETSVTIEWTTDTLSSSVVDYGLTTQYDLTSGNMVYTKNHKITLPPNNGKKLIAKGAYHFKVKSTDKSGNTTTSVDQTFTAETPATVRQLYRNVGLGMIIGGLVALALVVIFYFKNRKVVPFQPPI